MILPAVFGIGRDMDPALYFGIAPLTANRPDLWYLARKHRVIIV
jgi:hypothetical protein